MRACITDIRVETLPVTFGTTVSGGVVEVVPVAATTQVVLVLRLNDINDPMFHHLVENNIREVELRGGQ